MSRLSYRRAAAEPGKHGLGDYKVSISGVSPEHSELVFIVGMILLAEDRYSQPGQMGRYMLWYFLDRLLAAKSPEAVIEIAEDCQEAKDSPLKRVSVA